MPVRPRKIKDTGLFTDDFRLDGGKFWFLQEAIRPIVQVGQEGRFIRPGMIEDEVGGEAGNVAIAAFPDAFLPGQVWVIDHVGFFNGSVAAKLVGMVLIIDGAEMFLGSDAAVGILAPQEFLTQPITIDDQVGVQVAVGGAATDRWSIHAKRVA